VPGKLDLDDTPTRDAKGPGPGKDLVSPPTEQEGAGALVDVVDKRRRPDGLGQIPARPGPPARVAQGHGG